MPTGTGTRERLQRASLELFAKNGYDGTSTREIARRAGVNEVTIFRLFGSKEKLLYSALEMIGDIRPAIMTFDAEPSGDMVGDLVSFGTLMSRNMLARAPVMKLAMADARRRPQMWKRLSPAPVAIIEFLTLYFTNAAKNGQIRDTDPGLAATAFFSFFFRSLVMSAFLGKEVFIKTDRKAIEEFCKLFVEGLRKR